jgi:hypothetical protein
MSPVRAIEAFRHLPWRLWMARTPQWWLFPASAAAWCWLYASAGFNLDGGNAMQEICSAPLRPEQFSSVARALLSGWDAWCLMVLAMMLPLLAEAAGNVAFATPHYRRQRAIAVFALGYLLLWLALGGAVRLAVLGLDLLLPGRSGLIADLLPAAGFAIAAAWVWTPQRRAAQLGCSLTVPLRATGWGAERDCLRFGALMGRNCVRTCWAPMAALMLTRHGLAMMALVAALLAYERYFLPHKSRFLGYAWGAIACAWLAALIWR